MHALDGWCRIGTTPAERMLGSYIKEIQETKEKADRIMILNACEIYRSRKVRSGIDWPTTKQMARDFNVTERHIRRLKREFIQDQSPHCPPAVRPQSASTSPAKVLTIHSSADCPPAVRSLSSHGPTALENEPPTPEKTAPKKEERRT